MATGIIQVISNRSLMQEFGIIFQIVQNLIGNLILHIVHLHMILGALILKVLMKIEDSLVNRTKILIHMNRLIT